MFSSELRKLSVSFKVPSKRGGSAIRTLGVVTWDEDVEGGVDWGGQLINKDMSCRC